MNVILFLQWQEFGGQEDMLFCGVFDGHGPWGHYVAKRVRESMPSSLLCNWQETLAEASLDPDFDLQAEKKLHRFNIWKHSYLKTCAAIDQELEHHRRIDSFNSGTTALTIVRQVSEVPSCFEFQNRLDSFIFFHGNLYLLLHFWLFQGMEVCLLYCIGHFLYFFFRSFLHRTRLSTRKMQKNYQKWATIYNLCGHHVKYL